MSNSCNPLTAIASFLDTLGIGDKYQPIEIDIPVRPARTNIKDFKYCNPLTAIALNDYLALPECQRCEYFVSNTISIKSALAGVVFNDLYRQHGKYTFVVPTLEEIQEPINIGFAIREKISLFIEL